MITQNSVLEDHANSVLAKSPYLAKQRLKLEADCGRIVLRGVVETFFQKQMAQEAIRNVEGVHSIENELTVDWGNKTRRPVSS